MTWPQTGANGLPYWEKDPSAVKDYSIDWTDRLDGDVIATSSWTVQTGLTVGINAFSNTATTIWLSAGTLTRRYKATNRITTAGGRTHDQSIEILIKEQ